MPNTAPVVQAVVSTDSVKGGAMLSEPVQRLAVSSRDTRVTLKEIETTPAWVGIQLSDDQGRPLANQAYLITDSKGKEYKGTTDGSGMARLEGLPLGACDVEFPDSEEWKKQ